MAERYGSSLIVAKLIDTVVWKSEFHIIEIRGVAISKTATSFWDICEEHTITGQNNPNHKNAIFLEGISWSVGLTILLLVEFYSREFTTFDGAKRRCNLRTVSNMSQSVCETGPV